MIFAFQHSVNKSHALKVASDSLIKNYYGNEVYNGQLIENLQYHIFHNILVRLFVGSECCHLLELTEID